MAWMKQRDVNNLPVEIAVAHLVLAMHVGCNRSADGDPSVPRLHRQIAALAAQKPKQRAERDPAFDGDIAGVKS